MWLNLTPSLLRTHLAEPEIQALSHAAKPFEVDKILQEECHNVAEAWRGRLRQYHSIDRRDDYVPSELLQFILIHVRYASYTRLPAMGDLLDELRRREWERANEIFDNPKKIKISDPEEEEEDTGTILPKVIPNCRAWRFE